MSLAVLDTTALVNEAIVRHALSPVAAAALGRTLTATAYLCSWLKDDASTLSVLVNGGGVGGKICTAGNGALDMRGFVENPSVFLPPRADGKLDVGGFVGKNGELTVVRQDGRGASFSGACALVSGEIAEDFSAYFLTSEQRPTAIALGVRIGRDGSCLGAGGVFMEPLPGASEEILSRTEREIARFASISFMIEKTGAEEISKSVEDSPRTARAIRFQCNCSRKKTAELILSLGVKEARDILKTEGKISVHCHECNTTYEFSEKDVDALFKKGNA